nr:class I SAM-dependent methyltransferase [uncultured Xylophilus sp.]
MLLNAEPAVAPPSAWVVRWAHLVPAGADVLDVACGNGRHLRWFHARNHPVAGVDRARDAIEQIAHLGDLRMADIEGGPWPFDGRQFGGVVVTNYLHRPLLPVLVQSVAPGGVLIYETFATGQEQVGRPRSSAFLLQPGELLAVVGGLQVVAFEDGWLPSPDRRVQRIAAVRSGAGPAAHGNPRLAADSIPSAAARNPAGSARVPGLPPAAGR